MHFFVGEIESIGEHKNKEDSWSGEKFLDLDEVIKIIESAKEDPSTMEYRETQIKVLKELK